MIRTVDLVALALLLLTSIAAQAATYRCEVDGRTLYSDLPCPTGKQSTVATESPVTAADRAAAIERARSDRATLAAIEHDRRRERQEDLRVSALDRKQGRDAAKRTQACVQLSRRARNAHDAFDLAGPRDQPKTRLKMLRADEDYAALCKR